FFFTPPPPPRGGFGATPIRQIVQGQRSTYYCPTCQR
ncbi:zinc finger domain-containing protein, partial [Burkholderia cenocepacia]